MNKYPYLSSLLSFCFLIMSSSAVFAQSGDREWNDWLDEDDSHYMRKDNEELEVFREQIEKTLQIDSGTRINVDARKFGGIRVRGWNKNQVEVIARKKTAAITEAEARELARDVEVVISPRGKGIEIYSRGPEIRKEIFWSVSFDIYVPDHSDLNLETEFGGLAIEGVQGDLRFFTKFGSLDLHHIGGRVIGETQFGSVNVTLDGDRWDGDRLDVSTQFGSVKAYLPRNYSAELETGTSFGTLSVDFPVTVKGRIRDKEIRTRLGAGGAPLRLMTQFGGVTIRER